MKNLGYYNGKYDLLENMSIPMNDRVCWFGDGVYDALHSHDYGMFALDEHIARFFKSAAGMDIQIPVTSEELTDILYDLLHKMDDGDQFVYFQVTRGTAVRNHAYTPGPGNLWVLMKPAGIMDGLTPVQLVTGEDKRFFYCNYKTLNLMPSVLAAQKAETQGCWETIFYRPGGRITECAHSNAHILKDGKLITAPLDDKILPGIARAHLLKAAHKLGIEVEEREYYLDDVWAADEVMTSSSTTPVLRASTLDGKPVGGKDPETFEKLRREVVDEYYRLTAEAAAAHRK